MRIFIRRLDLTFVCVLNIPCILYVFEYYLFNYLARVCILICIYKVYDFKPLCGDLKASEKESWRL